MNQNELKTFLNKTDAIVGKKWLENASSEPKDIASYYGKLRKFYHKMHSEEGAMHFPIKPLEGGGSHADGLLFHVNDLDQTIKENGFKRVIEFGCGVGFNIVNLARLNPDVQFIGYDLTETNIQQAKEKASVKNLKNVTFQLGNFDTMNPNDFEKQDLIFSIEAMCHSKDLDAVIRKCHSILRPKGRLIIFDGYGTKKSRTADEDTLRAADYFSKGFFLPNPQYLDETIKSGKSAGFENVILKDYTPNILSNFVRFEEGVKLIFKFPWLTRLLIKFKVLPIEVFRHGLAGLYGPFLLKYGFAGYYRIDCKK